MKIHIDWHTGCVAAALSISLLNGLACQAADDGDSPAMVKAVALPAAPGVPRWRLSVQDMEASARFNYMDAEGGGVLDRGIQYRVRLRSRLDLMKDGRTYITTRAETGRGFNNSWNETAADLYPGQTIFNLKSIAIVHQFGEHTELQAGGLDFDPGAGGDMTYVSGDGTMKGYRAVLNRAASWLPDKTSITAGYVGSFDKPNVFSRFRMDRANYIQVLAQQRLGGRSLSSVELDEIEGAIYNREALRYHHPGPVDDAMVEIVTRATGRFTFAWSSSLSRSWHDRWRADLFYSDLPTRMYLVDGRQVIQNRGEIDLGKRIAGGVSRKLQRNCELGVFGGRLLDATSSKRWVAQAGISYQYSSLLKQDPAMTSLPDAARAEGPL